MDFGFLPSARNPAGVLGLGTWCRIVVMFPKQAALAGIRPLNIRDDELQGCRTLCESQDFSKILIHISRSLSEHLSLEDPQGAQHMFQYLHIRSLIAHLSILKKYKTQLDQLIQQVLCRH